MCAPIFAWQSITILVLQSGPKTWYVILLRYSHWNAGKRRFYTTLYEFLPFSDNFTLDGKHVTVSQVSQAEFIKPSVHFFQYPYYMSISQRFEPSRSRALLESPSTKHAKNVTRTNHGAWSARQKLKDCIYKQKMSIHIYSLSCRFWFGFSAHLILIKAFTKQVALRSVSIQRGPV